MTILEAVQQAVVKVGNMDAEDVVTSLLRDGINISPVNRVFKALDTIKTGREYASNSKVVAVDMRGLIEGTEILTGEYLERRKERVKARYHRLKTEGKCIYCAKERAIENLVSCEGCRVKMNAYFRRKRIYGG